MIFILFFIFYGVPDLSYSVIFWTQMFRFSRIYFLVFFLFHVFFYSVSDSQKESSVVLS